MDTETARLVTEADYLVRRGALVRGTRDPGGQPTPPADVPSAAAGLWPCPPATGTRRSGRRVHTVGSRAGDGGANLRPMPDFSRKLPNLTTPGGLGTNGR